MTERFDLAVIGGGGAGYGAAAYAVGLGLSVLHVAGNQLPGGLVANVGELIDYPSGPQSLSGMALIESLAAVADQAGVRREAVQLESIRALPQGFSLQAAGRDWTVGQVIMATGARLRTLSIQGAQRFVDRGVLQCAWCNAGLFRGRTVVVVGGGDAALQEALHLARYAARVVIVVRGDRLRARQSLVSRAADQEHIEFRWDTELVSIDGGDALQAIRVRDRYASSDEHIECDAVFPYLGLVSASELVADLADLDDSGAVITDSNGQTRTPGLFAVGALRSGYSGRLVSALGEASTAAIAAARRVDSNS